MVPVLIARFGTPSSFLDMQLGKKTMGHLIRLSALLKAKNVSFPLPTLSRLLAGMDGEVFANIRPNT